MVKRFSTLLLISIALLTFYIIITVPLVNENVNQSSARFNRQWTNGKESEFHGKPMKVKKIVAYSLLKQIEDASKEYICDPLIRFQGGNGSTIGTTGGTWTRIEETQMFVFSVHFDSRLHPYNFIRIIAMHKGTWNGSLYCQIEDERGVHHTSESITNPMWSNQWNKNDTNTYYEPVMLSCRVPINIKPISVTLSTRACTTSGNKFKINETKKRKRNFTVCVKPLNFHRDISNELVHWIELNKILGAHKIDIFIDNIQPHVRKILKKYEASKFVQLKKFRTISKDQGKKPRNLLKFIWQKRRYEIIAYNDCLYRNLDESNFVIPLDIDELIVPRNADNWTQMFIRLFARLPKLRTSYASFSVRNAFYLGQFNNRTNEVPFFNYVIRSEFSDSVESGKSFVSTNNTLIVFNHYALKALKPSVSGVYFLAPDDVQMNHYKETCSTVIFPECEKYLNGAKVYDPIVFKYKRKFDQLHTSSCKLLNIC